MAAITDWMPIRDILLSTGLGPEGFGGILRLVIRRQLIVETDGKVTMGSRIKSGVS
jgi:hypothetical protein